MPEETRDDTSAKKEAVAPAASAPTTNKLHEWGAAILIMVVLSAILFLFLSFLKRTSFSF